ncbi:DUF2231 domain-containing protein [Gandjariella thermophila]|uniref:DUF2231 domain-containing protein n=1 Tax=Gandjariella thermophila TaxID=1931992 RepID=A0A4D4IY70_9PSEU|nr:DUF2231 domain-containing protein [Gandjariella thermophila]GDY29181.1 hypothetical protein GTS_08140 [Gandjariella thermophila]
MPYDVFGLPLHPLVVHLTVVLVPVTAVALLVAALVPGTRRALRWPVAAAAVLGVVSVYVTQQAGEVLERQLPESDLIRAHASMADPLLPISMGVAVVALALLVFTSPRVRPRGGNLVLVVIAVLGVAVSVASVVEVVRIGHSGADAAWHGVGDLPVRQVRHPTPGT